METTIGLRVQGLEGMEKTMEITIGLGFSRNGKENENYYDELYRDYYKDPFLHS